MAGRSPREERFARQLTLEVIGEEGQRRLGEATAVVIGAGALGSGSAELLVRMGFGRVRVVDRDVLELHNLHRVRVLGDGDVGRPKAEALAEALGGLVSDAEVEGLTKDLSPANALAMVMGADVVLDGLDNMEGRYVLNDACLEAGVPWVYGGVIGTGGLVAPFPTGGPCLRCLFPEAPEPGSLPTCESEGIHPSAPAVVSAVQVAQGTKFVLGAEVSTRLLALDLWSDDWRVIEFGKRDDCPACVEGRRDFLEAKQGSTVATLCGQETVQINPGRHLTVDLEAKEAEWTAHGEVSRSGPMVTLDLGNVRLHLFSSGRVLVKGTSDPAIAKTLYARYVGH